MSITVNSALHPPGVAKSSTSFGCGKGVNATCAGWQVTLFDPMRHVSSRSCVATLRTAIALSLLVGRHEGHLAYFRLSYTVLQKNSDASKNNSELGLESWGSIYKISYDLSYDYRKFIVRSTYDSDLIVLKFLSGIS